VITRRDCALAAVAALGGFLGGAASGRLMPVHAQERNWPRTITAERFVAVDAKGARRVVIGVDAAGQGSLEVFDAQGRIVWSAPGVHISPADAQSGVTPSGE